MNSGNAFIQIIGLLVALVLYMSSGNTFIQFISLLIALVLYITDVIYFYHSVGMGAIAMMSFCMIMVFFIILCLIACAKGD
jgi:hypothetical protein